MRLYETTTQACRPSLLEAGIEAHDSTDSHWMANLSKIGMTRISRTVVMNSARQWVRNQEVK